MSSELDDIKVTNPDAMLRSFEESVAYYISRGRVPRHFLMSAWVKRCVVDQAADSYVTASVQNTDSFGAFTSDLGVFTYRTHPGLYPTQWLIMEWA